MARPRSPPCTGLAFLSCIDALRILSYEPLADIPLNHLSLKTGLLVMLASARRSNAVHGLSGLPNDVAQAPDVSLTLSFLPVFLA